MNRILLKYRTSWSFNTLVVCRFFFSPRLDLLKKQSFSLQNLQAQKTDNQQIKVKLRRLEEDNAKREKQIEELLDPTKVWLNHLSVYEL